MSSFGEELVRDHEDIVERWVEAWRRSARARPTLSGAALRDHLPLQLRLIGEQLVSLPDAEHPEAMWQIAERLEPELRVGQDVSIEEVVHEYGLVVEVVRDWIAERALPVSFDEYTYFYQALFALVAESVRRYASHQAEVVRKERSHYLAAVMHQLRTPLSVVSMAAQLLEDGERGRSAGIRDRLRRGVRRLEVLVNGVLRLERYRPEDLPVRPRELDLVGQLRHIVADYEHDATSKGLRIEIRAPSLSVALDPDLLTDALGNLVQNAVKYTSSGAVSVEACPEADDRIVISVRDTGPGIADDQLATLFHDVQPGTAGGAGIGLMIAWHAARAMGGTIEVESRLGRGSTFRVRLPRRVAPRGDNHAPRVDSGSSPSSGAEDR